MASSLAHPVVQDWVTQVQFHLQGDLITLRVGPLDENAQLQAEKSIAEAKRSLKTGWRNGANQCDRKGL